MRPDLAVLFELTQRMPSRSKLLGGMFANLRRGKPLGVLRCFNDSDFVTIISMLDQHGYVMWCEKVMEAAYPIPQFAVNEDVEPLEQLRLRRRISLGCWVPAITVDRDTVFRHMQDIGRKPLDWLDHFETAIAATSRHLAFSSSEITLYFRSDADAVHAKLAFHDIFYE